METPPAAVPVAQEVRARTTQETHTSVFVTREDGRTSVSWLGNLLWIWLAGGAVVAAIYAFFGVLLLCTIVLSPFGFQLLKLAQLALFPFGKDVESCSPAGKCEGVLDIVGNLLWFPVGAVLLLLHMLMGLTCACTCYGIPFAFQHAKLAQMALFPFGSRENFERESATLVSTTTHSTHYDVIDGDAEAALPMTGKVETSAGTYGTYK